MKNTKVDEDVLFSTASFDSSNFLHVYVKSAAVFHYYATSWVNNKWRRRRWNARRPAGFKIFTVSGPDVSIPAKAEYPRGGKRFVVHARNPFIGKDFNGRRRLLRPRVSLGSRRSTA